MDTEIIITGLLLAYPLITYIASKTPWDIDDKIVRGMDKIIKLIWSSKK